MILRRHKGVYKSSLVKELQASIKLLIPEYTMPLETINYLRYNPHLMDED